MVGLGQPTLATERLKRSLFCCVRLQRMCTTAGGD